MVYAYLWWLGLDQGQEYNNYLDMLFLKDSNSDLLLELESLTDVNSSVIRIKRYFDHEADMFDVGLFGQALFGELGRVYHRGAISVDVFAKKCYKLYSMLPGPVDRFEEPYNVLSYIDDMIEYNSLHEIHETIEKMLDYYSH